MFISIQPHLSQITTTTELNLLSTWSLPRRSDLSGFSPCVIVAHVVAATVLFTEKLTQCFNQLEKTSQCPSSKGTSKRSLCCQLCHLKVLLPLQSACDCPFAGGDHFQSSDAGQDHRNNLWSASVSHMGLNSRHRYVKIIWLILTDLIWFVCALRAGLGTLFKGGGGLLLQLLWCLWSPVDHLLLCLAWFGPESAWTFRQCPAHGLGISLDLVLLSGSDVATLLQKAKLDRCHLVGHWPRDQRMGLGPFYLLVLLSPLCLAVCPVSAP